MKKILTSHVGSLPRNQKVVDFIFARENEVKYDQTEFDSVMSNAVEKTVSKQVEAGVNIVSDGCLLYTSPSPRDHPRSRMPSSA